jgi:N6-L-threonylcarbamoyladenine synthase
MTLPHPPLLLAVDTSCDETSAAVTRGTAVLSSVIASQVRYHKKYGGVVPFLAQRLHRERIDAVLQESLQRAGVGYSDLKGLAVTYGPGLAPALEVGVGKVKELAQQYTLPLYAVNHMAGHIASAFAQPATTSNPDQGEENLLPLPTLAVLVSGGHTELVLMREFGDFHLLGQTLDDALGEAYDKVSKMAGLGYPGGKVLARLAEDGNPERYSLPIPMQYSKDYNLSYSGLKNAVRLVIEEIKEKRVSLEKQEIADLAAGFERAAQTSLLLKVEKVLKEYGEIRSMVVGGGVAANTALRRRIRCVAKQYGMPVRFPYRQQLCTDNAAMIGVAAWLGIRRGQQAVEVENLDRNPALVLGKGADLEKIERIR